MAISLVDCDQKPLENKSAFEVVARDRRHIAKVADKNVARLVHGPHIFESLEQHQ